MHVSDSDFPDYVNALFKLDKAYQDLECSVDEMPIKDKRHHERIKLKLEQAVEEMKNYLILFLTKDGYQKIIEARWDRQCFVERDKGHSELKGYFRAFVMQGEILYTTYYSYKPDNEDDNIVDHIVKLLNMEIFCTCYF